MAKTQSRGYRSAQLDRNPRVLTYDKEGTDDNRFILTLVRGYAFQDAAERTEDDPDGRYALHSNGFSSVKEALSEIRSASICRCGRCAGASR